MSERKAPDRVWIGPIEHDGEWVWNDHPWDDEGLTEYVRASPGPTGTAGEPSAVADLYAAVAYLGDYADTVRESDLRAPIQNLAKRLRAAAAGAAPADGPTDGKGLFTRPLLRPQTEAEAHTALREAGARPRRARRCERRQRAAAHRCGRDCAQRSKVTPAPGWRAAIVAAVRAALAAEGEPAGPTE
jgi:hypothetical protein